MKLKWKIVTGDEKLKNAIKRLKETFDKWFYEHWLHKISREEMLSPNSPLPHIYYKMCKTPEEVKEKFPYEALETCSSCGETTDIWIETEFSFCDEYGCGMKLCPDCARELGEKIKELQSMIE